MTDTRTISQTLAEFVQGVDTARLPARIVELAKIRLLDSLSTALAARGLHVPGTVLAVVGQNSGPATVLGQRRTLLSPFDSSSQDASKALVLQIEIEEFSQLFESADKSSGLLRLRATLSRAGPPGGGWLAQRTLTLQQSAATADAPGGVRALAASAKAAAQELDRWLGEFGD